MSRRRSGEVGVEVAQLAEELAGEGVGAGGQCCCEFRVVAQDRTGGGGREMVRRGDGGQTAAIGDALQAWIGGRGQARSLDEHGEGYVVGSLRHCGAGADHVVETGQQRPAARQVDGENVVAGTATGVAPPADTDRLLVFEPGKVLDGEGAWCPAQPVLEAGRGSSRAQAAQDITQSTVLDALGAGHLDPPGVTVIRPARPRSTNSEARRANRSRSSARMRIRRLPGTMASRSSSSPVVIHAG